MRSGWRALRVAGETPGFTLLEVLVALTIVGLVSIGALGVASSAMRASDRASAALVASELAEEHLARLRTLPPSALADSADGRRRPAGFPGNWTWLAWLVVSDSRNDLAALHVEVVGRDGRAARSVLVRQEQNR